ncbi:hypothetical protein [uncultured Umboniibacter sp.]|uniref:hypothetical protein n=1 Tax=uncultured Umboniibacter sp. TaxID=1798917 RepID=UPI00262805EC|nr:hypothetical protein [uncultured Umboniibacter sp.]
MRHWALGILTTLFFTGLSFPVLGNTFIHPTMERSNSISFGAFYQSAYVGIDSSSNLDSSEGLNLETLGVDTSDTSAVFSYRRRLSQRFSVDLSYSDYRSQGDRVLTADVEYNGTIFEVGARVQTEFKSQTLATRLTYDFYQTPSTALGIGVGIHAMELQAQLSGEGQLDGDVVASQSVASDNLLAPLPNLVFTAKHAFDDRLLLNLSAGWLSFNIDDYEGRILLSEASLSYRVTESASVAVAYQLNDINVSHYGDLLDSNYNMTQGGPLLMIKWAF